MTTQTAVSYEVFIARMGHYPDGSQGLIDATEHPLTDHFWSVWVMAASGDDIDEVEDHDFPLDAYQLASAKACELVRRFNADFTEL
ncbi:hypothetical protein FJ936_30040 [Mesorhizobium sp. B2-4-13]|uniref:hypothetical protein n=1 Tax=Mesorhizobium sp. B2-4-13 TaxID=2589936 RepID=UPI001150BA9D|nr:hypothetical protein [Mesorhizobium sp. B2-4-13]TPK79023.1 hypothetical protein FJ936_30040 [Mesorhizobium sp. B2-4-13]